MPLAVGQVVAGYEVTGILGAGGMGSVYSVRNLISGRVEAMKVLLPDLGGPAGLSERFRNEIKVLASLSHPHIASLHTALESGNELLMVMELIDGATLAERIASGPLPVRDCVRYAMETLSALSYAHQRGVIHRDIKPANIAVNSSGRVKLLDFGIARNLRDTRMTKTGMVLGSLHYMAPEQVNGQVPDERGDVYSLGATLYHGLTGVRPFDRDSEFALMCAVVSEAPPLCRERNPAIPEELANAVALAMAKQPASRFQSAEEFRAALERVGMGGVAVNPTPGAAAGRAALGSVTPIPSSEQFSSAVLVALQRLLVAHVGPISGPLVKKFSKSAVTLPDLCALLGGQIESEPARAAFLGKCTAEFGAEAGGGPPAALTAAATEAVKKDLARLIGPMARIVVDRAAKRAGSEGELRAMVAGEISSEQNRTRFLKPLSK